MKETHVRQNPLQNPNSLKVNLIFLSLNTQNNIKHITIE